jgi:hypothetical protein
MASVYLSYKLEDKELGSRLAVQLERLGHEAIYDAVALAPGKHWREVLLEAQSRANATVVLLTERAFLSPFVMGELGAARALNHESGRMLLIPVLVGDMPIPDVVQDVFVVRMRSDDVGVRRAAEEIDSTLSKGFGSPRVFISHRHRDAPVAEALVRLIEAGFVTTTSDMRCTSVNPYRLRAGMRTADRLRAEIRQAEAVLGILTPNTKDSSYVLFEMGASWGRGIVTFPLLAYGATIADVPAPIGDLHTLTLSSEADCRQLLDDLGTVTTLRPLSNAPLIAERVRTLVAAAASSGAGNGPGA